MSGKSDWKNSLSYTINQLSTSDKVYWILQTVLSFAILVIAFLGIKGIMSFRSSNIINLSLLTLLFVICGTRFVRNRIVYAIIYFVLAALMGGILIASFFI